MRLAASLVAGAAAPRELIKVQIMERFGWTPRQWREDVTVTDFLEILEVDRWRNKAEQHRRQSRQ